MPAAGQDRQQRQRIDTGPEHEHPRGREDRRDQSALWIRLATGVRPDQSDRVGGDALSRPDQPRTSWSPSTLTFWAGSGAVAGPATADPSSIEKWLPWHGHTISPSVTSPT